MIRSKLDPRSVPAPAQHPDPVFAEKRRHPRLQMSARCWIVDRHHTVYLRLYDLSLGGLSVRARLPLGEPG